jgi:hypothetical protein
MTRFVFSVKSTVEFTLKDMKLSQEQWDNLTADQKEEAVDEFANEIFQNISFNVEVLE